MPANNSPKWPDLLLDLMVCFLRFPPTIIGMNKMVINHLDKLFVTSDAATIIREVEVNHPAAKMIAMAAKMQESEAGDGTNFVISLSGELM